MHDRKLVPAGAAQEMKALNVAVWGIGPHAIKNILPALKASPGIHLYGLCSRNAETVRQQAGAMSCVGWTDPRAMLDNPEVDVVFLSTPIGLHAEHGKSVLLAKKHLWCEKPLADSLAQVSSLVTLSRDQGLTLAEGFMYLYHPHFRGLQEILRAKELGQPLNILCRFGIPPLDRPGFRLDPGLGGGAFWDVGCYPLSVPVSLFPGVNSEVLLSDIVQSPEHPVDTSGRAILRLENGIIATLEWAVNASYRNEIDIWGSAGSLFSERFFSKPADYVPKYRVQDLSGRESIRSVEAGNHFLAMFAAFRGLVFNSVDAENERTMIMRRANLRDQVRTSIIKGKQ